MSDVEESNQPQTQPQPQPQIQPQPDKKALEQREADKLKAKYPSLSNSGGSALLHKRLAKGQKYFDSGDYNMAKAKMNNPKRPLAPNEKLFLQESIGETIPTPETLPPRKLSQATSKLASGALS